MLRTENILMSRIENIPYVQDWEYSLCSGLRISSVFRTEDKFQGHKCPQTFNCCFPSLLKLSTFNVSFSLKEIGQCMKPHRQPIVPWLICWLSFLKKEIYPDIGAGLSICLASVGYLHQYNTFRINIMGYWC